MLDKLIYQCKSIDDVCEKLKSGEYVFTYVELKDGKGRAIVKGTEPYEVEFNFANGDISGLVCNCYCTGACKHEFAVMLQLKETLDIVADNYKFVDPDDYLAIVNKVVFFENVIDSKTEGTFTMG